MCVMMGFVITEMECKHTIYVIKEHEKQTTSLMTTCSVIIEAEKITKYCRQQVNAIVSVFHVHGVIMFTWLFQNAR